MQPWLLEHLGALEAAAGQLLRGCQSLRAAVSSSADAEAEAEAEAGICGMAQEEFMLGAEAELQQAATELWQLLDSAHPGFRGAPETYATTTALHNRCATPSADAPAQHLLALPRDVLAHVSRLAGKEARAVCKALLKAYGCPGTVLRHPPPGSAPDLGVLGLDQLVPRRSQLLGCQSLQHEVVRALCKPCPSLLHTMQRCRGGAWGPQVTRLELQDNFNPDYATMHLLSQALPNLRELKCAWWLTGNPSSPKRRMQLSALTALTALCSVQQVLLGQNLVPRVEACGRGRWSWLPHLAPNLRELEADLRFQMRCERLWSLDGLNCLTRLAVRFDPVFDARAAADLLAGGVQRLQSLHVQAPACELHGWGEHSDPGLVIHSMSGLTSLQLALTRDIFPRWSELPELQQLLLGYTTTGDCWQLDAAAHLAHQVDSFRAGPPPQLQALSLPVAMLWRTAEGAAAACTLAHVQQCTALTSLEVGMLQLGRPVVQWLQPVAALQCLRQLALAMSVDDMGQLVCLGQLPLLSRVWLHLRLADPLPGTPPAVRVAAVRALASLVEVRDLTLVIDTEKGGGDGRGGMYHPHRRGENLPAAARYAGPVVAALLAAAGQLPRLEVLDTLGVVTVCKPATWPTLGCGVPPAMTRLRQLLLRCGPRQQGLEQAAAWVRVWVPARVEVEAVLEDYARLKRSSSLMRPWSLQRKH